MKTFEEKVLDIVKDIKVGHVMTYKAVATKAGNTNASRAVGNIMAKNSDKSVPCHRVIQSDGGIGMYNGLQGKDKTAILKKEGVRFTKSGKIII